MDQEKIKKIEEEIRLLHLDNAKELNQYFWSYHIKPVVEIAKRMAKKYDADTDTVWLAAILHDIAKLDNDPEPHDEKGAKKAFDMLVERGFKKDLAQKVSDVILTHRCRKFVPESLEQKILASADSISHFEAPFHFWFFRLTDKELNKTLKDSVKKNERDFNEKIFFEEEKEAVRKEYEVLKNWFEFKV